LVAAGRPISIRNGEVACVAAATFLVENAGWPTSSRRGATGFAVNAGCAIGFACGAMVTLGWLRECQ
jgi:hypothetical protein